MRRKTFDALMTTGGLVLAAVLIVAGVLGLWAHNFVDNQVKTQLSQQQIFFPAAGSAALCRPGDQALPDQVRRPADDQRRPG